MRTNLFEPALYETVRAGLAAGDLATTTNALQNLLAWYPASLSAARAVLLTAQDLGRRGDPAAARKLLLDLTRRHPAPHCERNGSWPSRRPGNRRTSRGEAIALYDEWLRQFPPTTRPGRARSIIAPGTLGRLAATRMR